MLMCYLRVCPFTRAIGQDCTVTKSPDQCCPVITCPEGEFDNGSKAWSHFEIPTYFTFRPITRVRYLLLFQYFATCIAASLHHFEVNLHDKPFGFSKLNRKLDQSNQPARFLNASTNRSVSLRVTKNASIDNAFCPEYLG